MSVNWQATVDAAAAELARVSVETAELTPDTQVCRARTIADYHYAQIGNGQFLIPRKSEFDTVSPDTNETHSVTTFSACHEYTAELSVAFGGDAPAAGVKAAPKTAAPLPPGLSLTLARWLPLTPAPPLPGTPFRPRLRRRFARRGRMRFWLPRASLRTAESCKCATWSVRRSLSSQSGTIRSNRWARWRRLRSDWSAN
jgi:hypothetical protein